MTETTQKSAAPAYGSLKTVNGVLNALRENGASHIPSRIDKSVMPTLSGSAANETIATLKYLGLIKESGATTTAFTAYVMASDEERKPLLAELIRGSYVFIFSADFDLERATSGMLAEAFRQQGIGGSTLVRAVSFFLSACKEAGVKVSPSLKAPASKSNSTPKVTKDRNNSSSHVPPPPPPAPLDSVDKDKVHKFELPIPGKPSVVVLIPKELEGDDWEMFSQMFALYVKRWKGFSKQEKGPDQE